MAEPVDLGPIRRGLHALYIAVDESVARDINALFNPALDELEELRAAVPALRAAADRIGAAMQDAESGAAEDRQMIAAATGRLDSLESVVRERDALRERVATLEEYVGEDEGYECDACRRVFRGEPASVHPPSRSSADGLPSAYCPECKRPEMDEDGAP